MSATAGDCLAPTDVAGLRPAWRLRIRLVPGPFARNARRWRGVMWLSPTHRSTRPRRRAQRRGPGRLTPRGHPARLCEQRTRFRQKESAATGEERDEGENGDHEQHWVDDHAAGDRDDQKYDAKDQKHDVALPGERTSQPQSRSRMTKGGGSALGDEVACDCLNRAVSRVRVPPSA